MRLPKIIAASEAGSDQRIAEDIARLFEHTLVLSNTSGLIFQVKDGCVRISGSTLSTADAKVIVRQTRTIRGVKSIEDQISPDRR